MNTSNIETVTIIEKRGETPTKTAIKYTGRKRVQVMDDAELVPLVMLFWVAKCAGVKNRIDNFK